VVAEPTIQLMRCNGSQIDELACKMAAGYALARSIKNHTWSAELLKHMKSASIESVSVSFENVVALDVDVVDGNVLEKGVVKAAVEIGKELTNKFGPIHKSVEKTISSLGLDSGRKQIEAFSPNFKAKCL
jgi:hypothetical protein